MKGSRFSQPVWSLLGIAWILVILAMTMLPLSNFKGHSHWDRVTWIPLRDANFSVIFLAQLLGNILLFVPFGVCLVGASSGSTRMVRRRVVIWAALLSAAVEFFQSYSHNRLPSMTDVCMNVLGAMLGSCLIAYQSGSTERDA